MAGLVELAERLWTGVDKTSGVGHPMAPLNLIEEVAPGVAFYKDFSNLAVVKTGEGLVLLDTGSFNAIFQGQTFAKVRGWSGERIHTAIYTHGHVDHAYGLPPFLKEAAAKGWGGPRIVAHEAVVGRMRRYTRMAGWNSAINSRQFSTKVVWPVNPVFPTVTYTDRMQLLVGGQAIWLRHARGETDDHTWVFLPEKKVLYTGDLFIWAIPNAGNPQKVQRYAADWAGALREMAKLEAEILLPGHGLPVFGKERVKAALSDTAEYLESLENQTVALMNQGARLDRILREVKGPAHLAGKPYLQPVYDEPEFIVRNIVRLYGGWYSGVPSELKPAPVGEVAAEIAGLAGGVGKLAARARELMEQGNLRLACHVADWAVEADGGNPEARAVRGEIYRKRTAAETSTMAKGIFGAAARESGG